MTVSRPVFGALLALLFAATLVLASAVSAAGPTDISIVDQSYQPTDLTINAGDTVTWTVTKAIADPHSVTSGTGPGDPDNAKLFDSTIDLRNNGDTFQFTFTNPGTYAFYCQVHPTTMKGTITVAGAGGSGAPGSGSPAPSASGGPAASGPAASGASGAPASSGEPAEPPGSDKAPVAAADKAIAAGILGASLLLLFGSAVLYRRVNRG